jgi:cell division protein FtsB
MKEFQEKRILRKIFFSRFVFIVLLIVAGFLSQAAVKIYLKSRNAILANKLIKQEIEDLKRQKSELEAAVNRLETAAGKEEEIRAKFQVQKPGEKTVVIIDEEENKNNLPENSSLPSFFQKIWQFFKNMI